MAKLVAALLACCTLAWASSELPSPADVEKLICQLASQKQIEEKATSEVCMLINKTFPRIQFNPDCKTMLEGAWDLAVAQCPKQLKAFPNPSDLEKLACELASRKQIEEKATGEICMLINKTFPTIQFNPDCKTLVEGAWDLIVAQCPKSQEALPNPADIEKLVCELASKKQIEDKATAEICMFINKTFPTIQFNPDCKTMLEGAWDLAVAQCPKQEKAFPNPSDLEKLACELASQKQIEEKATTEICMLINKTFPTIQFNPDCKTLLEGAWGLVLSHCPKNRQALPSPADVEKFVCELASQKQIEDKATNEICMLINKTFPTIQFNPDCKTLVEGAWDIIAAQCPKGHEALPNPADIEKLVCELANQKQIEDKATNEICMLIDKTFPTIHFNPDCKTLVEGAWDLIVAQCPKGYEVLPSPATLKKLVCELASKKQIEQKAAGAICAAIHVEVPSIPVWACSRVLRKEWDQVVSHCPKPATMSVMLV